MNGQVITFYSYKGGVGRSFVLANVAAVLAEWGYKVLCIDWDLEAPGLNYYFEKWTHAPAAKGLMGLIEGCIRGRKPRWHAQVSVVKAPRTGGRLNFIPAGSSGQTYIESVQRIDWEELYLKHDFGGYLEKLRGQWKESYDFVLIDSRTGISDIGGICTVQLPDVLVFMFTANRQSIEGACDVARRSMDSRVQLPFERNRLITMPILARYEQRVEFRIATKWDREISTNLAPFYKGWIPARTSPDEILKHTRVPYVAYWTFGEQLPVVVDRERNDDPEAVNFSMLNVAALLANGLNEANQLVSSRESYLARSKKSRLRERQRKPLDPLVFLSHSTPADAYVRKLKAELKAKNLRVIGTDDFLSGQRTRDSLLKALQEATAFVPVVTESLGTNQLEELDYYVSISIRETGINKVLPIIRSDTALKQIPKVLLSLHLIDGRSLSIRRVVGKIRDQIESASKIETSTTRSVAFV